MLSTISASSDRLNDLEALLYCVYAQPHWSPIMLKDILETYGSLSECVNSACLGNRKLDKYKSFYRKLCEIPSDIIEANIEYIHQNDIGFISCFDVDFPYLLKSIYDTPLVLFYQGNKNLLNSLCLGIVGSRKSSFFGGKFAFNLAQELTKYSVTVVSGLALGIDAKAHKGALENGSTIAVLGGGFSKIYPRSHSYLSECIVEKGLLLSEFPPLMPPQKYFFPKRNRIINGLSRGICVIEATQKSGALITAQYALEEGRDVFAVPGNVYSKVSTGCHELLRNGAILLESIEGYFICLFRHA